MCVVWYICIFMFHIFRLPAVALLSGATGAAQRLVTAPLLAYFLLSRLFKLSVNRSPCVYPHSHARGHTHTHTHTRTHLLKNSALSETNPINLSQPSPPRPVLSCTSQQHHPPLPPQSKKHTQKNRQYTATLRVPKPERRSRSW